MAIDRWDVIAIPPAAIGFDAREPEQYGVVVSSTETRDQADRLWTLFIPNPGPRKIVHGDVQAPYLHQVIAARPAVIRCSVIFTVRKQDVQDQPLAQLSLDSQRNVMRYIDSFLPRR